MEPEDKKSNGALVGLVIIILILIIGGIYMWQKNKDLFNGTDTPNTQSENTNVPNTIEKNSVELDALEQELNNTDLDVGTSELDTIQ